MTREPGRAPPRNAHGDLTSLAPLERLPEILVVPRDTKIRLIIFFAAKDGEALHSQQKQDQELTVAQTMNSLLPNSDLN